MKRSPVLAAILAPALALLAATAAAQQGEVQRLRFRSLDEAVRNLGAGAVPDALPTTAPTRRPGHGSVGGRPRPVVMLTGYWPPTNEMLRRFSTDAVQNPQGWIGSDWEGRGFDVHAFFPEFDPPDCFNCGKGSGDFEVDYQDTSADFWPIAGGLAPIAMITFSRGFIDLSWEVEMNQFNYSNWFPDFVAPTQPTPNPPDGSVPGGTLRLSKLPVQEIVDAVNAAGLGLNAYICFTQSGGNFLSGFMAYHGVWYQSLHEARTDPDWCIAAGHVHVGGSIAWPVAEEAAKVTIRAVLEHVDGVIAAQCVDPTTYCIAAPNSVGPGVSIGWSGAPSTTLNAFDLTAAGLPPGQSGLFYYGSDPLDPPVPFGDGWRCVRAPLVRLGPPVAGDGAGEARLEIDFSAPPASTIGIGGTRWFQLWYRDPAAGGAGWNTSDGLRVTVCP